MRHDNKLSVLFPSQEAKNETISGKSLGPGLPLAQQIVVAHGESIAAKARHPHGTTFEIWLPAFAQATSRSPVRRVG